MAWRTFFPIASEHRAEKNYSCRLKAVYCLQCFFHTCVVGPSHAHTHALIIFGRHTRDRKQLTQSERERRKNSATFFHNSLISLYLLSLSHICFYSSSFPFGRQYFPQSLHAQVIAVRNYFRAGLYSPCLERRSKNVSAEERQKRTFRKASESSLKVSFLSALVRVCSCLRAVQALHVCACVRARWSACCTTRCAARSWRAAGPRTGKDSQMKMWIIIIHKRFSANNITKLIKYNVFYRVF